MHPQIGQLNFEAARAAMRAIPDYMSADLSELGILPEDLELLTSDKLWRIEQRQRIARILDVAAFGTTNVMQFGKMRLPAEFCAAVISVIVAPCNRRTACHVLANENGGSAGIAAIDAAAGYYEPCDASQIFALVILLGQEEDTSSVRQRFIEKFATAAQKAASLVR